MSRKTRTPSDRRPAGGREKDAPPGAKPCRFGRWALIGVVSAALIMVLCIWPVEFAGRVLPEMVLELLLLAGLLFSATALGSLILGWLRLMALPRPLALLAAAALGIGAFSILLLIGGLAGWIGPGASASTSTGSAGTDIEQRLEAVGQLGSSAQRWFFFLLPVLAAAVGIRPLMRLWRTTQPLPAVASSLWTSAAAVLVPTLIVVLAAANLPPGVLWNGNLPPGPAVPNYAVDLEGHGYDCLEYHLQAPREFLDNGRIGFLSHNVYAAFPQNAEMWFMFLMGLVGRPQSAVFLIQWLNVLMTLLTVGGVYLAARMGRPTTVGAIFAVIAVAATPMLAAVSVVAYVEPMMLMFFAVALALIRHYQLVAERQGDGAKRQADSLPGGDLPNIALAIGLMLGFAAGTKYLAIPLFILPLAVGLLATGGLTQLSARVKLAHVMLFASGALVAFAPWMFRNSAQAGGNPLFPLLWSMLGGGNWTAADALRWQHGHQPDVGLPERFGLAGWRFFSHPSLTALTGQPAESASMSSSLYGAGSWLLAWPVFLTRQRSRWDWMLLISFAGQLGFWMFFTHEPGRFMLPAVIVLGLLVGRSIESLPSTLRATAAVVLLTLAAVSGLQLVERFGTDTRSLVRTTETSGKPSPFEAAGLLLRSDVLVTSPVSPAGWLNRWLAAHNAPADRPVLWMVGDACPFNIVYPVRYEVAFSHSRLADALAMLPPGEVADWFRRQGCRYLYVDWREVARLRSSYGFPDSIRRETLRPLGQVYYALETEPTGPLPVPASQPDSPKSNLPEAFEPAWLIELPLPSPPGSTTQSEQK